MAAVFEAIDLAIQEVTAARKRVAKIRTRQLRGVDELTSLKSDRACVVQHTRGAIAKGAASIDLSDIDERYQHVLDATTKHVARKTYLNTLRDTKEKLLAVRAEIVKAPASPIECL